MRTIYIPAISGHITLKQYVNAVKLAKDNPDKEFKCGFTTWWPTTGREVMRQFYEGITDRINQEIPYIQRGNN